jgi:hypothetical protein
MRSAATLGRMTAPVHGAQYQQPKRILGFTSETSRGSDPPDSLGVAGLPRTIDALRLRGRSILAPKRYLGGLEPASVSETSAADQGLLAAPAGSAQPIAKRLDFRKSEKGTPGDQSGNQCGKRSPLGRRVDDRGGSPDDHQSPAEVRGCLGPKGAGALHSYQTALGSINNGLVLPLPRHLPHCSAGGTAGKPLGEG